LLYEYAVRNYVPVRHSVAYDVLRRRRPGEAIPAGYWHRNLGRSLKLLYVPSYSKALEAPACRGGPDCAEYVVARSHSPLDGQSVKLAFKVGSRTFWAIFRARSGVDSYPVRLDRLWFWPMLGAHPRVRSATPGWRAHLAQLRDGDALY
jgi:hypothetical protein